MITINIDKIKRAYTAVNIKRAYSVVRYPGGIEHYIVITFWMLFRWRKFSHYVQRLNDGMGWRSAYYDTLIK
jgi:hypothetical protein